MLRWCCGTLVQVHLFVERHNFINNQFKITEEWEGTKPGLFFVSWSYTNAIRLKENLGEELRTRCRVPSTRYYEWKVLRDNNSRMHLILIRFKRDLCIPLSTSHLQPSESTLRLLVWRSHGWIYALSVVICQKLLLIEYLE